MNKREPILGGKKLDLLRIYKTVMDAGGYEKVTQNRGWKQVGDPFDFPPTCTNSAYILKAVYIKNLLGWEEEHYWKRPWNPPKEQIEPRPPHSKISSPMPVAPVAKPRDTARQTATAFNHQHQHQQQQQNHVQQQPQPQQQQPQPYQAPQQQFHPTIQNMRPPPPQFMQQLPPTMPNPVFYPPPIFVDEEFRSRLLLALKSDLPNEIDWAFNTLVRISFNFDALTLDYMPTLIDTLIDFAHPFYKEHVAPALGQSSNNKIADCHLQISPNLFSSKKNQVMFERVLQVFHILRNFSFLEVNIRRLAHHGLLRQMLMMGIALPPDSPFAELSRHCLDILENIAPQVIVSGPTDPYILTMVFLLFTNDRALILGAIRSLTRVGITEVNERVLGTGNPDIIRRMSQLLLVDDEEMAAATLEYFYQCSSLNGNFSSVLVKYYPGNLIGLLTGYLSYKSILAPRSSSLIATIHGIPQTQTGGHGGSKNKNKPFIPDLSDYIHLDEPYRCLGWLKEKLEKAGLEDKIELNEIFGLYRGLFGTEKPLGLKEFYTVLKIAFPQPKHVEAAFASGQIDTLILQNVKYAPLRSLDELKCKWVDCGQQFENDEDLHKHILETHIVLSKPKTSSAATESTAPAQPISSESTTTREVPTEPVLNESTTTTARNVEPTSSKPITTESTEPAPGQPTTTAPVPTSSSTTTTEPILPTSTASVLVPETTETSIAEKDSATETDKNENDEDKMDVDESNNKEKMDIDDTNENINIEHPEKEEGKEREESPVVSIPPGYRCQWLGCKRAGFKDKQSVVKHLKTHFAGKIKKKSKKRSQQNKFVIDNIPVDDSEVSGVPLTAALLLRNLAKDRHHHSFFMPYQSELAALAIQRPKLARYILTVLGELKV
ncbi:hypothetical protein BDC45DRAFT_145451 [Circinella umbellata]|nr:hypothetical protein BDC45DRAFT_145451 [Circinella umbellata]